MLQSIHLLLFFFFAVAGAKPLESSPCWLSRRGVRARTRSRRWHARDHSLVADPPLTSILCCNQSTHRNTLRGGLIAFVFLCVCLLVTGASSSRTTTWTTLPNSVPATSRFPRGSAATSTVFLSCNPGGARPRRTGYQRSKSFVGGGVLF